MEDRITIFMIKQAVSYRVVAMCWQDIIQGKVDEIQRHFSESIYERNRINLFVLIVILRLPSY